MSHPLNAAPPPARQSAVATTDNQRAVPTNGRTIPVSLSSISQQLPANFLSALTPENVSRVTVNIPADWIIPQLAQGRVTITLADLLPLLPEDLAGRQFPTGNSQHAIVLPLADMVTSLPMDLLQHQNQTAIDLDTPEFAQFPKLVDDTNEKPVVENTAEFEETVAIVPPTARVSDTATQLEEPVFSTVNEPPAIKEEAPLPRTLAGTMAKPIPAVAEPQSPSVATQTPTSGTEITVSLRSLVAVMPDQYFVCPRTDLWRRIDLDTRIALPSDLVVPQLKVARVRLPLTVAVGLMPRSILAAPLPSISDETIPIALQEIVSQLSPNLFSSQTNVSDLHEIDFSDSEIPTPFAEKNFVPATVEIRTAQTTPPEPAHSVSEPETRPEPIEIATGAFADDALSIFAERSTVAEPPAPTKEADITAEAEASVPETVEPTAAEPVAEVTQPVTATSEEPIFAEAPQPAESADVTAEASPDEPAPVESVAEVSTPTTTPEQTETVEEQPPVESFVAPVEVAATNQTETPVAETPTTTEPEGVAETQAPEETTPTSSTGTTSEQVLANLNNHSLAELCGIEGIDPVLAQRIIEFRNERGGFKSIDELREIPGVGRKLHRLLAGPSRRGLNRLLGIEHNDELTLQEVVRLTSQQKGVAGCILAMSDGVFLTGQLPPHLDQETISVFAPQLFRKVGRYMKELRAGQVTRLSVFTDQQPISIFSAGDIFLIVIHDNRHFSKALLRRCERISQELAPLCRQRTAV